MLPMTEKGRDHFSDQPVVAVVAVAKVAEKASGGLQERGYTLVEQIYYAEPDMLQKPLMSSTTIGNSCTVSGWVYAFLLGLVLFQITAQTSNLSTFQAC